MNNLIQLNLSGDVVANHVGNVEDGLVPRKALSTVKLATLGSGDPTAQSNHLPCAESVIREGNGQGDGVPVHSSARGDSKSVPKNSAGISQSCGSSEELPLISDSQMDLAWAYFWGKRKMIPPTVSSGGIMPSVSDFDDELSILQMRASI